MKSNCCQAEIKEYLVKILYLASEMRWAARRPESLNEYCLEVMSKAKDALALIDKPCDAVEEE